MKEINLYTWIDKKDIEASKTSFAEDKGPILNTIMNKDFSNIYLLDGYHGDENLASLYSDELNRFLENKDKNSNIFILKVNNRNSRDFPVNFDLIFNSAYESIFSLQKTSALDAYVLLAPGSSVMHMAWPLIITKLKQSLPSLNIKLISSSIEGGIYEISSNNKSLINVSEAISRRESFNPPSFEADFKDIIGTSAIIKDEIEKAQIVSQFSLETVLIEGPSGSGKELFAQSIHKSSSRSKKGNLVCINCGAYSDELFRSELFGFLKGSFTGADKNQDGLIKSANNGTLFLDEIADLSMYNQQLLLRFLSDGKMIRIGDVDGEELNVRIITATNKSLISQIEKGLFREDLYFRLSTFRLTLPPLTNRSEDIELISKFYLKKINKEYEDYPNFKAKELSQEALEALGSYNWPGNVRELIICLKNCAVFSRNTIIMKSDVNLSLNRSYVVNDQEKSIKVELRTPFLSEQDPFESFLKEGFSIKRLTDEIQNHYLKEALSRCGGNKKKAGELLGLKPQNVQDWIERFNN